MVDGYWQLSTGSFSPWLKIQLRGMNPPLVLADVDAQAVPGRLVPLLRVASVAAWRMGPRAPEASLRLQMHDEDPGAAGIRFDAPLADQSFLIPDPYALGSEGYRLFREKLLRSPLPPWRERIQRAFWRGSSTGSKAITIHRLNKNLRYNLCAKSVQYPRLLDARFTSIVQCRDDEAKEVIINSLRQSRLMASRCDPWYFGLHQFLIEIDGNVNSWGLLWKLISGSCVLKVASTRRQWYHPLLKPFCHIIPVASDLSDLPERLEWCLDNPDQCEVIASEGRKLALRVIHHLGHSVLKAVDSAGPIR